MVNNNLFNEEVGLLKRGAIVGYDVKKYIIKVKLSNDAAIRGNNSLPIDVPFPHTLFYNNEAFIGMLPSIGTPIIIGQGSGGQHYFVSFLSENTNFLPNLKQNELLIKYGDNSKVVLNSNGNIAIGSDNKRLHINTTANYKSSNFDNNYNFTQASRNIDGVIKRDVIYNVNFDHNSKLEDDIYDSKYIVIGLDPTASTNSSVVGSYKNPPLVEKRELIYEFQNSSNVTSDLIEANVYTDSYKKGNQYNFPNRRQSRADTLSLSLVEPNYLIETVKGTVVDIFGNILDINRTPLPIGKDKNTIRADNGIDKKQGFLSIKELERKSIAYHFEINAKKDLANIPDISSKENYAKSRSRFFLDIDKEGQFKLNVPASSEVGNVPLLSRYENYSTFGKEDDGNPNKLIYRQDNLDIFLDSFAASKFNIDTGDKTTDSGSIKIVSDSGEAAPIDRITNTHIRHGTAHHDILSTCYVHQKKDFLDWQAENYIDIDSIPLLKNVVSDTIQVSGKSANAGGRSGSINFDGSIELNIGANTVDRQSLWLDTAGGIVANIGRDNKNMSAAIAMNGDVFMQFGGLGISIDPRFEKNQNGHIGAVVDLRFINSGLRVTMIRVDDEGVKVMTPGNMHFHSGQNMKFTSDGDMSFVAENMFAQNRLIKKEFGGSM